MDENLIKEKVKEELIQFSEHSIHKMDENDISSKELIEALYNGEIIEDYPEDERGHSCLFLCKDNKDFFHVVLGQKERNLFVVTVYRPSLPKFIDERTRGREE